MSFQLKRGEIYGFLGPNGSGKTTTIRMIVSLIGADSGDVLIEGNQLKRIVKKRLATSAQLLKILIYMDT